VKESLRAKGGACNCGTTEACEACWFVTVKLNVYVEPATTVPLGVNVRLPALVQAPVGAKMVEVTARACVGVVVPTMPLSTTEVLTKPLTVKHDVYRGTLLVKVTVNVLTEQGFAESCVTAYVTMLDLRLSGSASPVCGEMLACVLSKVTAGAKLALLEFIEKIPG